MRSWRHSGFGVDNSVYLSPRDTVGREQLSEQPKNWFVSKSLDRFGFRFGSDVFSERRTPTLGNDGSLNRRWLAEHYALAALQEDRLESRLEFRFFDGLGHRLGKEEGRQVGTDSGRSCRDDMRLAAKTGCDS